MRRSLIRSKDRLVINDSFIVLARALCYIIITLLLSQKNVIDAVESEGNLNRIGSLRPDENDNN